MARKFHSRPRGTRRETSWISVEPVIQVVDNSVAVTHTLNATALAKRSFTIIRTRLEVHINSDQLAVDEIAIAAIGLCVVSDQASGIGVTAVPTPITDLASDLWFVHQPLITDFTFVTGIGIDADGGTNYSIDSKAMRKVNDDEQVIVVVEGSGSGGGAGITIIGRMLIKEH